jgi:hypothetical protein
MFIFWSRELAGGGGIFAFPVFFKKEGNTSNITDENLMYF